MKRKLNENLIKLGIKEANKVYDKIDKDMHKKDVIGIIGNKAIAYLKRIRGW